MSLFLQSTYLSAALSLVYIYLLYRSHPHRRLPAAPTVLAFAAGMLAVSLVVAVRRVVPIAPIEAAASALFAAAAVEEVAKLLLALATIWRLRFPNVVEPIDVAILFGVLGVGFGIYEDFWYIFSATYTSWIAGDIGRFNEVFRGIVLARAFPGHILFNGISGFLLGHALFAKRARRLSWILAGLALAILLHAGFNWVAINGEPPLLIAYVVGLVGLFLGLRRRLMARSPFAALIRRIESEEGEWTFDREPIEYLFADGFGWPGRRRGGLFQFYPVVLSLCVLFPLLLIAVYFVNRALLALL
ncbi:MAG: PrsW family glutamic-type intramembrane protease [Candidatus Bipolaricaulia bacterium]